MLNTPFPAWPAFSPEESDAVAQVLKSGKVNYWTGEECREFEKEFAEFAGTSKSVALANGTLALDAVWAAMGIGAGDEVIVTPRSFTASASSVVMAGGTPVFADIDRDSQNITAATIAPLITSRTKAVLCVHLAGWPCDMDPIREICAKNSVKLVEDCAQAHGAEYMGTPVGGLGDAAAWSFCQDKIMSTGGEGGAVTTSDEELWSKVWSLKDHGKSFDAVYNRQHAPGFRWLHETIGSNWRMLEMQGAIARIQLRRMPQWAAARRQNAERLQAAWGDLPALRVPVPKQGFEHAWYKFYAFARPENLKAGWSRDRIVEEINRQGVPCYTGSCPEIYREKAYADLGIGPAQRLPAAVELGETSLMFLVHPTLAAENIEKAAEVCAGVARQAQR